MDEKLKERLNEMGVKSLDRIEDYLKATENFVIEQAPLLVQEIVHWEIARWSLFLTCWLVVFLSVCSLLLYLFRSKRVKKWLAEDPYTSEGLVYMGRSLTFLGVVGSLAGVATCTYHIIYPIVAPRLFLLEKFAELIK